MTAATAMVPFDPKAAVFWSNLVEAAYSTFYINPGNPNPQPPAFPAGWTCVATLQVDLNRSAPTTSLAGFCAGQRPDGHRLPRHRRPGGFTTATRS